MEVNLTGLALPVQIICAVLLLLLAFIGKRLLRQMDRLATSVENLNVTVAGLLQAQHGLEKRIELLEAKR
jgi:hypothetical protein